ADGLPAFLYCTKRIGGGRKLGRRRENLRGQGEGSPEHDQQNAKTPAAGPQRPPFGEARGTLIAELELASRGHAGPPPSTTEHSGLQDIARFRMLGHPRDEESSRRIKRLHAYCDTARGE